jgi:hypothetical protein
MPGPRMDNAAPVASAKSAIDAARDRTQRRRGSAELRSWNEFQGNHVRPRNLTRSSDTLLAVAATRNTPSSRQARADRAGTCTVDGFHWLACSLLVVEMRKKDSEEEKENHRGWC